MLGDSETGKWRPGLRAYVYAHAACVAATANLVLPRPIPGFTQLFEVPVLGACLATLVIASIYAAPVLFLVSIWLLAGSVPRWRQRLPAGIADLALSCTQFFFIVQICK